MTSQEIGKMEGKAAQTSKEGDKKAALSEK